MESYNHSELVRTVNEGMKNRRVIQPVRIEVVHDQADLPIRELSLRTELRRVADEQVDHVLTHEHNLCITAAPLDQSHCSEHHATVGLGQPEL